MKTRLFALLLILICAGLTYYGWHQLLSEGRYPLKVATFAPVGIVGGLVWILSPEKAARKDEPISAPG